MKISSQIQYEEVKYDLNLVTALWFHTGMRWERTCIRLSNSA